MDHREPRTAVVGAGAIGGVTAAFMKKAGYDPVLVCKHADTAALAHSPGLHVSGLKGDGYYPLRAVPTMADLPGIMDVVFLATKANDCLDAARGLLPVLHDGSLVVSLQNGISEEALAGVLGRERVVGCVTGWGATMHGPAELEVTSPGEFVIGNIDHHTDPRLGPIREMLDPVAPCRISENIMGELYSKLIINSCINTLGVITGQPLGRLLADARVRRVFIGLMREAVAVADAMGLAVPPGGNGRLDYARFLEPEGLVADLKRHLVIRVIGFKYRRIRSSSLQSIERGRRTEVEYLNGYVCTKGLEKGVPTPLNQAVREMVHEIEEGRRRMSADNLKDPLFRNAS